MVISHAQLLEGITKSIYITFLSILFSVCDFGRTIRKVFLGFGWSARHLSSYYSQPLESQDS